jgi:nucleoside 2-deoxyribosyltransferase
MSPRTPVPRPVAYVSGPLQAATDIEQARRFYELLASICRACGCDAYLPHQRTDPVRHRQTSARAVFTRDLEAVSTADIVVAYVGVPSSGVGAELGIAHERNIPVIGLCGPEGVASRFVEGLLDTMTEAHLLRYRDEEDCRQLLAAALEAFVARRRRPGATSQPQRLGGRIRHAPRQSGRSSAPS